MNILFHTDQISESGTEVALYDYAIGNETILKGVSFIAVPINNIFETAVLEKFKKRFVTYLYKSPDDLAAFIKINSIDLLYQIKSGKKEELIVDFLPVFIHCVFTTKEKFGTYYCPVSPYLNRCFGTNYPVLPHIVKKFSGVEENFRHALNIPESAVVFGGYGRRNVFDIGFVKEAIMEIASKDKDIYFLFMNFDSFTDKTIDNIIFLPKNVDINYKEMFINTCDAMIHARADGETFGLAVAEFSVKNKPIVTWAPDIIHNFYFYLRDFFKQIRRRTQLYRKAHLDFLGKKAVRYHSKKDLLDVFGNFKEKYLKPINYDCYSERFSEENVMRMFADIIGMKF